MAWLRRRKHLRQRAWVRPPARIMTSILGHLLLALFLFTAGCIKVGPDFAPPPVSVSPTWLESADKQVSTQPAEYRAWWRTFNDPVLDRLIDGAYRENLTLELSYFQSEIGGTASWELDFWGKFRRAIESADATLFSSVADYDNTLVTLTADVANAYINIRTLEKRLLIAHQNVATQTESLRIAQARFKGGTTSQRDVEQAKTVLASTEALIPSLKTQLRQAKNGLCVLLGLPPSRLTEKLKGPKDIPSPSYTVAVGIPADLLRRRPDVKSAEYQAVAQCAQIGVAKADLLPAFSLTGTFGFLSANVGKFSLGDMFLWQSRTMGAGPTLQWNILNYGRLRNNVRVQDARFQELLLAYQNTVLQAQQEVEDSLVAFLQSQKRAGFLAESASAALKSVDLAVIQYREGITDFTTVLTAQQSLLAQQDNLASTLGDISTSLVGVYRALGGGWEIREGEPLVPTAIQKVMAERTNWGRLLQPTALGAKLEP